MKEFFKWLPQKDDSPRNGWEILDTIVPKTTTLEDSLYLGVTDSVTVCALGWALATPNIEAAIISMLGAGAAVCAGTLRRRELWVRSQV